MGIWRSVSELIPTHFTPTPLSAPKQQNSKNLALFCQQRWRRNVVSAVTKRRCCHLDAPLLCGPWSTGLGGSERVRLCPGGGGGALFLDRVELPPALDCDPSGREVGGPVDGAERVTRWRDWSRNKWGLSAPEHKGKDSTPITIWGA